jgi:hypothetical protein
MNDPGHEADPQQKVRDASNQVLRAVTWLAIAVVAAVFVALCVLVLTVISWG